jgi:hypothetical protein
MSGGARQGRTGLHSQPLSRLSSAAAACSGLRGGRGGPEAVRKGMRGGQVRALLLAEAQRC